MLDHNLDKLFDDLEKFLTEGGEGEETEPQVAKGHEETDDKGHALFENFDVTEVFITEVKQKATDVINLCDQVGIPAQWCFYLKATDDQAYHETLMTHEAVTSAVVAAHSIYFMPHSLSHLIHMFRLVPPGNWPPWAVNPDTLFDHQTSFDNSVWPKVEEVVNLCRQFGISCQWGAIPAVRHDSHLTSMALYSHRHRHTCPMNAAIILYNLPPTIQHEVAEMAFESGLFDKENE